MSTAGVNAERASTNGDPEKYYGYPKFSASYRLPWLPTMVDELKVRAAYGRAIGLCADPALRLFLAKRSAQLSTLT